MENATWSHIGSAYPMIRDSAGGKTCVDTTPIWS